MKVLAFTARNGTTAAALAVDGRIVSAAEEAAGAARHVTDPIEAVRRLSDLALSAAGLAADDLDGIAAVAGDRPDAAAFGAAVGARAPVQVVDGLMADAVLAQASAGPADAVVVGCLDAPALVVCTAASNELKVTARVDGMASLEAAATALARALGARGASGCGALDRLSQGAEPLWPRDLPPMVAWHGDSAQVSAGATEIPALVARVAGEFTSRLTEQDSLNQRVQDLRRGLAASFVRQVAETVNAALRAAGAVPSDAPVAFGGDLFAHPRLRSELQDIYDGEMRVTALAEPQGRALGAALIGSGYQNQRLDRLALGPSFSDQDIKRTLDNCRLDYVYEPDWARLNVRVSRMLEQGKVVAWFQGHQTFGPRSFGTRSVLSDPSNRYARQNINEYLRQRPVDEVLPVVLAPSAASACLSSPVPAPLSVTDSAVQPAWREKFVSALDWRQRIRLHAIDAAQAPELCQLLELHLARTGVPGLIETELAGPGEPAASTPREAVRSTFASAMDALVIGRFVLMKDHWLLRSHVD